MQDFYRRVSEFKEIVTNQVSMAVVESTGGLNDEMRENIDKKTRLSVIKGFNDLLSSLETLEKANAKKKTTTRRTKAKVHARISCGNDCNTRQTRR